MKHAPKIGLVIIGLICAGWVTVNGAPFFDAVTATTYTVGSGGPTLTASGTTITASGALQTANGGNIISAGGMTASASGVFSNPGGFFANSSNTRVFMQSSINDGVGVVAARTVCGNTLTSGTDRYVHEFCRDGSGCSNPVARVTSDGTFLATTSFLKAPVVHGAATALQAIETGSGTASAGGALAVTFGTAFTANPNCVCADTNAAPVACGISTAASTTAVTFTIGAARADVIQWNCVGAK